VLGDGGIGVGDPEVDAPVRRRLAGPPADVFDDVASEILSINRTDMRAVDIVNRRGRVAAGELAEEAGLTTGAVTPVVDQMERGGLLKRARDPDDRRRVWLETTPLVLEKTMPIWGRCRSSGSRGRAT
jgi:hypothetical protein